MSSSCLKVTQLQPDNFIFPGRGNSVRFLNAGESHSDDALGFQTLLTRLVTIRRSCLEHSNAWSLRALHIGVYNDEALRGIIELRKAPGADSA